MDRSTQPPIGAEIAAELSEALATFSPDQRLAVFLHYYADYSVREVARSADARQRRSGSFASRSTADRGTPRPDGATQWLTARLTWYETSTDSP